ncbi:MAG: VWA domain-containing protein [Vitreoscilla sp.]|nr:VWA domain-containing protein [Polaromonas sp.]
MTAQLLNSWGPDLNLVAALFAVDPCGLGGVALRASAGQPRDQWLALLNKILPAGTPQRRIPLNINDAALLGGLDLGATLGAGRPIAQQGVLAHADGGVVLLAMAERVQLGTAARLAAVLDTQIVAIERDGLALKLPARLGVVALDEGIADDEQVPSALLDRLAFLVRLKAAGPDDDDADWQAKDIAFARELLPRITVSDDIVQALCAAALALGVYSLRAPIFAMKAARCAAALDGLLEVTEDHTALAARLVLAPRATQLPPARADNEEQPPQEPGDEQDDKKNDQPKDQQDEQQQNQEQEKQEDKAQDQPDPPPDELPPDNEQDISNSKALAESVLDAAQAAIPDGLLAALQLGQAAKARAQAAGRSGAVQKSQTRGRPMGARRGEPRAGARLNVIETLRAAAPWQKLRQLQSERQNPIPRDAKHEQQHKHLHKRIYVRREDFHVTRFKQVGQTTTLFVVDASGSSALNRLAEAKGAVELLLADCYVRRDHVAVLAFRGKTAELLLPPTRSLARAKRSLGGLPGGGGTPLATAIDVARELAEQIRRRGETPIIVLLTDGRGNIGRDGSPGRVAATEDAMAAARQLRAAGFTALLIDTSNQPQQAAQLLATQMGAAYVPLPHAGAQAVSRVVQLASAAAR